MNLEMEVLLYVESYQSLCVGRTPSIRLITQGIDSTVSHQTVYNALNRLEKLGYIERGPFVSPNKSRSVKILEDGQAAISMFKDSPQVSANSGGQ
jgi:DNA-binding MarR family transcriptional regulator